MLEDTNISRKISIIEIIIVVILVIVWISSGIIIFISKKDHLLAMASLQEKILEIPENYLNASLNTGHEESVLKMLEKSWPPDNPFKLFIAREGSIIFATPTFTKQAGNKERRMPRISNELLNILSSRVLKEKRGEAWIGRDKNSGFLATWSVAGGHGKGIIIGILSSEDTLLSISGYYEYRLLIMVCAGILSVLILFLLIWSLSWIRITYLYSKALQDKE